MNKINLGIFQHLIDAGSRLNRERLSRRRVKQDALASKILFEKEATELITLKPTFERRMSLIKSQPLISVIWLPDFGDKINNPIDSIGLSRQIYPLWELLTDVNISLDDDILSGKVHFFENSSSIGFEDRFNSLLTRVNGDYVLLIRGRDRLAGLHALLLFVESIDVFSRPPIVYSDERSFFDRDVRHSPQHKCSWNQELQRATHYLGRSYIVRTDVARQIGGLMSLPDQAGEQLFVLRASEARIKNPAVHIPHTLYERYEEFSDVQSHAVPGTEQQAQAVQAHLNRCGVFADVQPSEQGVHVRYAIPSVVPLVSLIVPTRNGLRLIRQCVESVLAKTTYPNYELIVVDNGSDDSETLNYFSEIIQDSRIKVRRDGIPFNFSALNNRALNDCGGDILVFLNNDTEVISPDWLEEMVGLVCRPDVGAVGARLWFENLKLQHAGVLVGVMGAAAHAHLGLLRQESGYLGRAHMPQEFSAVTAACMMMRREVFEEVGGFDAENLAIDLSDIDLCLKVRSAGYRVIWTPHAELFHHESATRGSPTRPDQLARYMAERQYFSERWQDWLVADPAYNPNLTLDNVRFSVANESRVSLASPWYEQLACVKGLNPPSAR